MNDGRKQTLYERNPDLFRILGYGVMGFAVIGVIILLFVSINSTVSANVTYHDDIADVDVNPSNLGGIANGITFINGNNMGNEVINDNVYADSLNVFRSYLTIVQPTVKKFSYKSGSSKYENETYTYTVVTDTGKDYYLSVKDYKNGKFYLEVADKNNTVFKYDSMDLIKQRNDPRTLPKYLPKVFSNEKPAFSLTQNRDGSYQININSCGDDAKKKHAREVVNEWLENINFDSKNIEIKMPDMCDGGLK